VKDIDKNNFVQIGHIIRPHGVAGLLKTVSYAQSKETFLKTGLVYVGKVKRELEEHTVVSLSGRGSRYLLKLAGVESLETAQQLRGAEIWIGKEFREEKQEGDFYYRELIGLSVYLDTGHYLGVLKGIFPTGSNDVYVVKGQGKEYLIPAIYEVIQEVHASEKRMIISAMKGLLDL
jgi:16S rRNA processing protein RimM